MAVASTRCWQKFQCGKRCCPAYLAEDPCCWVTSGTHCREEVQRTFRTKMEACLRCEFFQENAYADKTTMERTLKFIVEGLVKRHAEVEQQCEALENSRRELMALNKLFIQLLDREHKMEEIHARVVESVRPLLDLGLI